jgi:hypothetical protein
MFKRECGLFQGSLLSPFLFNIFIDPLAKELQKESDLIEAESTHPEQFKEHFKLPPIKDGYLFKCQMCPMKTMSEGTMTRHINKNECSVDNHHINEIKQKISKTFPRFLFYADDIEINGRNTKEVQRLLTVIEKWCKDNYMIPGLKKCQWVGPPEVTQPLYLNQTPLEKVENYKYLGVPMTYKGVDFVNYMKSKTEAMNKRFWYLHSFESYLPNSHRLYLVKSEVLSILEYSLPLYGQSLETNSTEKRNLKNLKVEINQIIDRVRKWAGFTSKNKFLAQHLTNIYDLTDTMKDRISGLNLRLEKLPKNHPIIKIKEIKDIIPEKIRQNSILFKSFESELLREYKEEKQRNPQSKMTLKQFQDNKKIKMNTDNSTLACYTMIPNKNKQSKTDITYRIRNRETRENALKWRKNLIGYYDPNTTSRRNNTTVPKVKECRCMHCNVKFTRSHVNTCPLITQSQIIPKKQWNMLK